MKERREAGRRELQNNKAQQEQKVRKQREFEQAIENMNRQSDLNQ